MSEVTSEPRLLFPQLQKFYDVVEPLSWPLVRVAAGLMLLPHGIPKLINGYAGVVRQLVNRGIEPSAVLAPILIANETIGGLCIALGLFTRFWAAAVAIEMAILFHQYFSGGFNWVNRGYEYPLFWGLIMFAIALRGGGPYSLDRKLGVQL